MLLRQCPKSSENVIAVNDKAVRFRLGKRGFTPIYLWRGDFFYINTPEFEKILREEVEGDKEKI